MKLTKSKSLFCLGLFFIFAACTISGTEPNSPEFQENSVAIEKEFPELTNCERAVITGKNTETDGKTVSAMEIKITNSKSVLDDLGRKSFAKKVASLVKNELKNPVQYDIVHVIIESEEQKSVGSFTKTYT